MRTGPIREAPVEAAPRNLERNDHIHAEREAEENYPRRTVALLREPGLGAERESVGHRELGDVILVELPAYGRGRRVGDRVLHRKHELDSSFHGGLARRQIAEIGGDYRKALSVGPGTAFRNRFF